MKAQSKKTVASSRLTHQVRLIGGMWKRTPLDVISAEGLRPTPDRVRETVFNWLNHLYDANWQGLRCLDLFSGSGALGFEVASRGAAHVTMVEVHTPAFRQLEQVKQKLGASQIELIRGDALSVASSMVARQQRFDLILLDPPFNQDVLQKILPSCARLLSDKGLLYVEAEHVLMSNPQSEDYLSGWQVIRADKAGSVYFHILQRNILAHDGA
ncbi:MAG: 16S rRNA (guanine(966)-N(2))-methyltransferase RsmD [Cytophaga sp.]|nr:16S rRNA (guanine(966)-N(2))-methyltransferase RsmD [Undibacterium sp.]